MDIKVLTPRHSPDERLKMTRACILQHRCARMSFLMKTLKINQTALTPILKKLEHEGLVYSKGIHTQKWYVKEGR